MKVCMKCKTRTEDFVKFCSKCGCGQFEAINSTPAYTFNNVAYPGSTSVTGGASGPAVQSVPGQDGAYVPYGTFNPTGTAYPTGAPNPAGTAYPNRTPNPAGTAYPTGAYTPAGTYNENGTVRDVQTIKPKTKAAFPMSIVAICMCWLPVIDFILATIALIMSITAKARHDAFSRTSKATAALVLSIISMVLSICAIGGL